MDKDKIKLNTNIRDILASKTEADELNDLTNMQKRNINEITVMPEVTLATSLRNQNLPVKPCSDNISLPRKGCTSLDVVPAKPCSDNISLPENAINQTQNQLTQEQQQQLRQWNLMQQQQQLQLHQLQQLQQLQKQQLQGGNDASSLPRQGEKSNGFFDASSAARQGGSNTYDASSLPRQGEKSIGFSDVSNVARQGGSNVNDASSTMRQGESNVNDASNTAKRGNNGLYNEQIEMDDIDEDTVSKKNKKNGILSVNKNQIINELKTPLLLFVLFTMLTSFQYLNLLHKYLPRLANIVDEEGHQITNVLGMLMKSMIFVVLFVIIRRFVLQ